MPYTEPSTWKPPVRADSIRPDTDASRPDTDAIRPDAADSIRTDPPHRNEMNMNGHTPAQTYLDLPPGLPAARVGDAVMAAAREVGLVLSLEGTLRSYPGSQHWHLRQPNSRGVLELTWWPQQGRLWPKVAANRTAAWIDEALPALMRAIRQWLDELERGDVEAALDEAGLPAGRLALLLAKGDKRIYRAGRCVVQLWYGRGGTLARSCAALQSLARIAQVPQLLYSDLARPEPPHQVEIATLLPGITLEEAWPDLDHGQRRSFIRQLGGLMEAIHTLPSGRLAPLAALDGPLPWAERCRRILADRLSRARRSPQVDATGLARVAAFVQQHQAELDCPPLCLVHTDIHLGNVLVEGDRLSGLIDFEFAEVGGRDRDAYMLIGDAVGHLLQGGSDDLAENHTLQAVRWLQEDYPALYATPGFATRQLLYLMLEPESWSGTPIHRIVANWPRILDSGWIARWFEA